MKKKDLDTYISDKLEQGTGLPYKEAYWSDMDALLDANMPVAKPAMVAAKGVTSGLKLLYLSSVCAAIFAVSYTYTHIFNSPSQSFVNNQPAEQTQQTTEPSKTNATAQLDQPIESTEIPTAKAPAENEHTLTKTPSHKLIDNRNNNTSTNTYNTIPENRIIQAAKPYASIPARYHTGSNKQKTSTANGLNTLSPLPETAEEMPSVTSATGLPATPFSAETFDQTVTYRTADFTYIAPLATEASTELGGVNHSQLSMMAYPRRNRLIQHIALSPFIGMVQETGTQTYRTGNIHYKHAAQSQLTYGVNLECATGRFAVRTGVGFSQTVLQTTTASSRDIYTVDTTFVVLNPNYGTTLSGKPIALVQRQIDSSYSYSQQTTAHGSIQYRYLTVPLTLQYRVAYKRMLVVLEGGALHHFRIATQQNSPIQTSGSENPVVLPVYNLQLTAGSSLRYAISSKWAVGVQYNYCLSPSSANLLLLNNAHLATFMLTRTIR